jgi:phospholipid/cholesterol/gamma-HCH transport system permease protein
MVMLADAIGHRISKTLFYIWELFCLFYLSLRSGMVNRVQSFRTIASVICSQIYFTGFQALPLISVLATAAGALVVLQSTSQFSLMGGGSGIGQLMVVIVVRELAPLMTALIVIARSGTAVASEIGTMRVNREIQALESMGINPQSFIIFPRVVGGVVSVICLSIYFLFGSILGGLVIAKVLQGLPVGFYFDSITQAFTHADVWLFILKNLFSGVIIFTVASYQGLRVKAGPHEVPQVTTKAVMDSIVAVIMFNMSVTALYYLSHLKNLGVI